MTPTLTRFEVRKTDLAQTRLVHRPLPDPAPGQVRVRIGRCAYTANNITYAAFGAAMQYWDFFPTGEDEWGCIPVWGFGVVEASAHPDVAVGERLYGYWPTASHALLTPERVRAGSFFDGAPHRADLHAVYNQVTRCKADPLSPPAGDAHGEAVMALLRPLFTTAWLIDDLLADQAFHGALRAGGPRPRVVLSSASSKTAVATAAHLARRDEIDCVALTSPQHRAFCEGLGLYRQVLAYDDLAELPAEAPTLYVDFAGSAGLRRRLHTHLTALVHSMSVGGTHVDDLGGARDLPGPRPVLFFAPAQIRKRVSDWGPAGFEDRLARAWQAYVAQATAGDTPWLRVVAHAAPPQLQALHARMLQGHADPAEGHVLDWPG